MKKLFFTILIISIISCDDTTDNNPNLPNFNFSYEINLNLSEGLELITVGGYKAYYGSNVGLKGIVVHHVTQDNFIAFELACPHLALQDCSTMTVSYPFLICPCDDEKFSIIDGGSISGLNYAARQYTVTKSGDVLIITN